MAQYKPILKKSKTNKQPKIVSKCSTINKIPETYFGVQPEDQKAKQPATGSSLYLSPKMMILPSGIPEQD